jgi:hypothetical protein
MAMDKQEHGLRELKIPSVDWVAFVLGVVGLVGSRFDSTMLGLLGLAVFGPPLLREIGLLKDCDEFTRNISRRAGFHAALVVAAMVFINHLVVKTMGLMPTGSQPSDDPGWAYSMTEIRFILVVVFLMSSLYQYWGSRLGSFRILLGIFGFSVMNIAESVLRHSDLAGKYWGAKITILVFLLTLAFAARRQPKITGSLILVACLYPFVESFKIFQGGDVVTGWIYTFPMIVQSGILAVIGLNLLGSGEEKEPDQ